MDRQKPRRFRSPRFGNPNGIVGLDTEAPNGWFAFCVTRQASNRSESRRAAAHQGRFGAAQRVGATRLRIVSDEADPPHDDTAVLADHAIDAGTDRRPRTA